MFKLPDDVKQFYIQNDELLERRLFLSLEVLEDRVFEYGLEEYVVDIFKEWNHVLQIARDFWEFPSDIDMMTLVDKYYCKKTNQKYIKAVEKEIEYKPFKEYIRSIVKTNYNCMMCNKRIENDKCVVISESVSSDLVLCDDCIKNRFPNIKIKYV